MKNSVIVLLSLFTFCSQIIFSQVQELKGSEYCYQNKIHSQNIDLTDNITANIIHSFDAVNYKLNLDIYNCFISPYPKSFTGSEILTFEVDSALNSITLNAVSSSLTIGFLPRLLYNLS